jgi:thiol-disulfide isomerase/thioredoxin
MKRISIYAILGLVIFCETLIGQHSYKEENGETHLLGQIGEELLLQKPFSDWYTSKIALDALSNKAIERLKGYQVKIFLGTWCGDSRKWVPQFVQLWKESGLSKEKLAFIALHNAGDQYKRSPKEFEKGLNIHRVPTFIFYKDGQEVGRIVESPTNDLLTDIEQIALGIPSKPRYKAVSVLHEQMINNSLDSLGHDADYGALIRKIYREVSRASELNTYGYVLKVAGEMDKAEFVFGINTVLFRHEPNTWDSLGEVNFEQEKYDLSKLNYENVLRLDPENEDAKKMIAKIEKESNL